jgi:hypothetical protein
MRVGSIQPISDLVGSFIDFFPGFLDRAFLASCHAEKPQA